MRILPRPGETTALQEGTMDPVILEYIKNQGPILPRPKDGSTSDTQGLKDDRNKQQPNSKQASESGNTPLFPKLFAELARQKGHSQNGNKIKQSQKERVYNFVNPADGFISAPYYSTLPLYSRLNKHILPRSEKDKATPVEEAYFKHYLNIGRDKELVPDTKSRIDWDKNDSENPEYIGVPQPAARRVQAIADTLNTGKIYREYDKYKDMNPDLPTQDKIGEIYKFGKTLLESDKGKQANEGMSVKHIERPDHYQQSATGLEVLGNFGLKWDKNSGTLKVYDTYDFPSWATGKHKIPERERPLRIREDIKFNPEKGSYLLRDNMKNYHEDETKYYK